MSRTILREQIKGLLLERSPRGDLEPNARLVETRLARELGTSQAPVREALPSRCRTGNAAGLR